MMFSKVLDSWKPRSYQTEAVRLGITQACAGFLLRPGMGKTTIAYAIIKILREKRLIKRTLVVCPIKPMYNVWPKQKDMWLEFTNLKVNVCHGKNRVENLKDPEADICCINPEGLEWIEKTPGVAQYVQQNFDVLVVDESTKFKNTGTQRFKRMRKFIKYFKRRYILTGTFTPNGLLDLFGQIYVLDEGAALGAYITAYKNRYFHATDYMGYNLAPNEGAAQEIAARIAPLTLVMEREGNLDMPELLPPNDILVDLPPAARTQYVAMEENMLAAVGNSLVTAANAAVATSKCRQIANGALFNEAGAWHDIHSAKLEALEDLIDELSGEPALVCYEFKFDLEKLQHAFPNALLLTTGNAKRDDLAISAFSAGMAPVALAQISSISLGIDGLQNACSNVVMYSLTWNLQDYSQTIDRVWRSGQRAKYVSVHRILARDTVDERVLTVLNNKDATQSSFLEILKQMRK